MESILGKGEVMENKLFANAKKFAQITGRPIENIRELCRLQQIPCERTGKEYSIDIEAAIAVLKQRAADFEGHKYDFTVTKRPEYSRAKRAGKKKSEENFLADLGDLKNSYKRK